MNPLLQLLEHGQSYWLDNLTRRMIRSGELERRVREQGLRGVTSNPSIFNKAISGGDDYDDQIEHLAARGAGVQEIYEELVVTDIRDACDVLRPVYDESDGTDGFVSLEVSPHLAHDTQGSIAEARRLFEAVDRPNVLIKIPGTPAGVPAVEELLYEGVNVNITLLFSVEAYEEVARAYLRALERRLEAGSSVDDVASVASFFLSRIDVLVDRVLGHRILPETPVTSGPGPERLMGRCGVANAKVAYRRFQEIFRGGRWERLAEAGATPQRMLWASTSTKNPLYSDVKYVEPLIGPHTVNTLPERTIAAFADHGTVETTVEDGLEEARETLDALEEVGIDFDQVTEQLLHEGVEKFVAPYDRLMATLGEQRAEARGTGSFRAELAMPDLRPKLDGALEALDQKRFPERMRARDPTAWTADPGDADLVADRLGWLDAPREFRDRLPGLADFAAEIHAGPFDHVVQLGMGGSVLAAETLKRIFGSEEGAPELIVLDDTSPEAIRATEGRLDLERTLFVVASKSGSTVETLSLFRHFYARVAERTDEPGRRFVAVTDPGTPLAEEARRRDFRRCFENPADVGGRYSALTWFGLVPAALLGARPAALLERAERMLEACDPAVPSAHNPGIELGLALGLAARGGRDKVTLFASEAIAPFRAWAEQLLAESLGKDGVGVVPVEGEEPAATDAYGSDRLFVYLRLEGSDDGGVGRTLAELNEAGHPVVHVQWPDRWHVGAEFLRWEVAAATAGAVLGVNPFDEPDVAAAKEEVHRLLEAYRREGELPSEEPASRDGEVAVYGDLSWLSAGQEGILERVAGATEPGDYLAVLAYFPETPERWTALQALRRRLWSAARVPVTVQRGPRYLHSTGQLHKGGPDTGVFLILTAEPGQEVPIPGEAYGFGTLHRAQALADQRILARRGRRVLRLDLMEGVEGGLAALQRHLRSEEESLTAARTPA